ncbi:hypothetical protein VQ044_24910 [Aurantimonas sp. C2-5-R2]|uniref:hypothetical protein n=1 Tax=Aurantimonas sp. C2-5-R2 TaxID=3113713 RepID=UPI002F9410BA
MKQASKIRTYTGTGYLVFPTQEIPISYSIELRGNADYREAHGTTDIADPKLQMDAITRPNLRLRLEGGEEVEVVFDGGSAGSSMTFTVNTRMPGA